MKDKFGEEWYELLKDYLESPEFNLIGTKLHKQYEEGISIIPEYKSPLYFKIFKDLQPSDIKIIVLGLDPYHNKENGVPIYTGYAFDNANSSKLSPSLRNIFKEIDRTYPENYMDISDGRLDMWDLSRWVRQGVFLVNTALSVVEGSPGAHTDLWRDFTIEWISRLSESRNELIWLLMGKQAQVFEKYINNTTNRVFKVGHPSPLNRTNPFVGCNAFKDINEDLVGRNKTEILW